MRAAIAAVCATACRIGFDVLDDAATARCTPDAPPAPVSGTTYYVGLSGVDGGPGSMTAPWATFGYALATIAPGDELVILDGVYTEPLAPRRSGTPDRPFTIRAAHDGGAVMDGMGQINAAMPCDFTGDVGAPITDYVVEGISCRNGPHTTNGGDASLIVYHAERITLRRVTASEGEDGVIEIIRSNDILVEDCAAWGYASLPISVDNSQRVTLRRCWAEYSSGVDQNYAAVIELLDSTDSVIENCIAFATGAPGSVLTGFDIQGFATASSRNLFVGNIAHGVRDQGFAVGANMLPMTSNQLRDNVVLGAIDGVNVRADVALGIERLTVVGGTGAAVELDPYMTNFGLTVKSIAVVQHATAFIGSLSSLLLSFTHDHNVLFEVPMPYLVTGAGTAEVVLDPGYDTARYGNGAYLMRPPALASLGDNGPAGAEILYRSVNGTVTQTPLWPWPMNDRIRAEHGVDVTASLWRELPALPCN